MSNAPAAGAQPRRGASVATAVGLVAVALAAVAANAGPRSMVAAAAVYLVVMAVVLATVDRHHGPRPFGLANFVTTARAALTALVAGLAAVEPRPTLPWWIVLLTITAMMLDGVDGRLARRTGLQSRFGARYDTEIDALLILVLSVLVWRYDKAGAWVLACGTMRYGFAAAGWVWPWLAAPLSPTLRGKTVAVIQFAGLAVSLVPGVRPPVSTWIVAVTLAALTWSFAADVRRLGESRESAD